MKPRLFAVLAAAILVLGFALPIDATGPQSAGYLLRPLIVAGDPAPPVTFGSFGAAAMNDNGDVVFVTSHIDLAPGLFLHSSGRVVPIALRGQEAPGTGGAQFDFLIGRFSINNSGAVAFAAGLVGGSSPEAFSGGIFLFSAGRLTPVVLAGQMAPGTTGRFSKFIELTLNDSGAIAFSGFFTTDDRTEKGGIFLAERGTVRPVVLPGESAPGTAGGRFSSGFPQSFVVMNNVGAIAFSARLGGGNVTQGIFLFAGNELTPVALSGQEAPLTGGKSFHSFSFASASLNDHNELSFTASLTGDPEEAPGFFIQSLFLYSAGRIEPIAIFARQAPGVEGGTFLSLLAPSINNSGSIAFYARLEGGLSDEGIYLSEMGRLRPVALVGQEVAGAPGETVSAFDLSPHTGFPKAVAASLNDRGDVAFLASTTGQTMRLGVFLASDGTIIPLVTSTDRLSGSFFSRISDADGPVFLNDQNEVAFLGYVPGNGEGLYRHSANSLMPIAVSAQQASDTGGGVLFNTCLTFCCLTANDTGAIAFTSDVGHVPREFTSSVAVA